MLQCRISITKYPSQRHFIHRYGIAITRPGQSPQVKDVDTDNELSRILEDVCGHTKEESMEILEDLSQNQNYGPYTRSIDEIALTKNGF